MAMRTIRAAAIAAGILGLVGCNASAPPTEPVPPTAQESEAPAPALTEGSTIAGDATAHDGDDLIVGGVDVRLNGFDTPEADKICGSVNVYERAAQELASIVEGQQVSCEVVGIDRYGRAVGRCSAGADDVGERMVSSGWARDWPRYSQRRYAAAEADARADRRGIWGLQCPADLWSNRNYD